MICCLSDFIEEKGMKIINDQELCKNAIQFTQKLLDFKKEIDQMLEDSFMNNLKFEKGRDSSF